MLVCLGFGQGQSSIKPPKGFVPDAKTATRIAEAVLIPIYGELSVSWDRPLKAKLEHGTWTVVGTMHCQENLPAGHYCFGGHWVRLSKADGRILQFGEFVGNSLLTN